MNNPAHWPECVDIITKCIDACADAGFPSVITFTGMREPKIPDDLGMKNCVTAQEDYRPGREEEGDPLALEMLNSRVDVDMKGHPVRKNHNRNVRNAAVRADPV